MHSLTQTGKKEHKCGTVPDSKEWNEILKLFPLLV